MQPNLYQSFATLAANGSTATFALPGNVNAVSSYFGTGVTFGSGTLTLEVSPDGGTTWISTGVTITTGTANTFRQTNIVFGSLFRWTLSGATSPSLDLRVRSAQVRYGVVDAFTFTANGSTAPFVVYNAPEYLLAPNGFDLNLTASGTWGSGTLALEASPDGGTTWFRYTTLTANGYSTVNTGISDVLFRLTLSGATSPALAVRVHK